MRKHIMELINEYFNKLKERRVHLNKVDNEPENESERNNGEDQQSAKRVKEISKETALEGVEKLIETVFAVRDGLLNFNQEGNIDLINMSAYSWYISRIQLMRSWKENGLIDYDDDVQQVIDEVIAFAKENKKQIVGGMVKSYDIIQIEGIIAVANKIINALENYSQQLFSNERDLIAGRIDYLSRLLDDADRLKEIGYDTTVSDFLNPNLTPDIDLYVRSIWQTCLSINIIIKQYIDVSRHNDPEKQRYTDDLKRQFGFSDNCNEKDLLSLSREISGNVFNGASLKPIKVFEFKENTDMFEKILKIFNGISRGHGKIKDYNSVDITQEIKTIANDKMFSDALISKTCLTDEESEYIFKLITSAIQSVINKSYLSMGMTIDYENGNSPTGTEAGCADYHAIGWHSVSVYEENFKNYIPENELNAQSQLNILFVTLAHETKHIFDYFWTTMLQKESQEGIWDEICEMLKSNEQNDPNSYVGRIEKIFNGISLDETPLLLLGLLSGTARDVSEEFKGRLESLVSSFKDLDYTNSKAEKDARMYGAKMSQFVFALLAKEYSDKGMNEHVQMLSGMAQKADKISQYHPKLDYLEADEKISNIVSGIEKDLTEVADPDFVEILCRLCESMLFRERDMQKVVGINMAANNLLEFYINGLPYEKKREVCYNAIDAGKWRTLHAVKTATLKNYTDGEYAIPIIKSQSYGFYDKVVMDPDFDELSAEYVGNIKKLAQPDASCIKKFVQDGNFRAIGVSVSDIFRFYDLIGALDGEGSGDEKFSKWIESLPEETKYSKPVINMLRNMLINYDGGEADAGVIKATLDKLIKEIQSKNGLIVLGEFEK